MVRIVKLNVLTVQLCHTRTSALYCDDLPGAVTSDGRATEVCADLAYIYSLLTRGLNLNPDRVQLRFLQHIDGATLGWGIGALLDHMSDPELGSS
mmetsp:Transcript_179/g.313  ORF Transcript_179/g.313 Transcript_179/m.313 type:complete len:95 (+) Transcript_179:186-470(+)